MGSDLALTPTGFQRRVFSAFAGSSGLWWREREREKERVMKEKGSVGGCRSLSVSCVWGMVDLGKHSGA